MKICINSLKGADFKNLRKLVKFKEYSLESCESALLGSFYVVHIEMNLEVVAMGRIISDGEIAFFIKDVIVLPEFQQKKFGDVIMKNLLEHIKQTGCDNAYIGLMSTCGCESFYQKYGFIQRPNEKFGAGMIMYNEGRKNIE